MRTSHSFGDKRELCPWSIPRTQQLIFTLASKRRTAETFGKLPCSMHKVISKWQFRATELGTIRLVRGFWQHESILFIFVWIIQQWVKNAMHQQQILKRTFGRLEIQNRTGKSFVMIWVETQTSARPRRFVILSVQTIISDTLIDIPRSTMNAEHMKRNGRTLHHQDQYNSCITCFTVAR